MIEVRPIKDLAALKDLYIKSDAVFNDSSSGVAAYDRSEILGYCLFYYSDESISVTALEPKNDLFLADGILRSALHVGVENGKNKAFYTENAPFELLDKLKFVKNTADRVLDIDKLFSSCPNCGNN